MDNEKSNIYVYGIEWGELVPEEHGLPRELTIMYSEEFENIEPWESSIGQWLLENYNWTPSAFEYIVQPIEENDLKPF